MAVWYQQMVTVDDDGKWHWQMVLLDGYLASADDDGGCQQKITMATAISGHFLFLCLALYNSC